MLPCLTNACKPRTYAVREILAVCSLDHKNCGTPEQHSNEPVHRQWAGD
jgi:hypothetical protein